MGRRIPDSIRKRVAQQWVSGISREVIARDNQISTGTVSKIINEFKENGFDLDLLREVALVLKREGLRIDLLPSAVRLRNRLEERGLDEIKIDSLIETIDVHCFRRRLSVEQFVDTIQNLSSLSEKIGMPLDHLPMHVDRLKQEIKSLEEKMKDARTKVRKFVRVSYVTMDEVDDYKRNKHKLRNYESLRKQADELQQQLNYYNGPGKFVLDISEEKLKNLSTILHKSLTISDLVEMLHYLCTNPTSNIDIFNALAARWFGMSSDTQNNESSNTTKYEKRF